MALEDLLSAMRSQAEEEIARLERDGRRKEEEILAAAEREGRAAADDLLRSARRELEAELERRRSHARLEARAALREAREEAFQELVDEARARLAALREDGSYPAIFAGLLSESRSALPAGRLLHVDPRDEPLARQLVGDGSLAVEADLEAVGGLELESHDGRLLRNTLEVRLAAAQPRLRLRFAEVLAEGRAR
jgi:vacuolar-type H+-ATPase subunit E/Vma4